MPILGPNIANLQAQRDIAGLIQACKSKSIRTRCAALVTLGKIGDARALPHLEVLMCSDNRGVARDAKQCVLAIRQRLHLPTVMGF
jgi:HEAT repeat protein